MIMMITIIAMIIIIIVMLLNCSETLRLAGGRAGGREIPIRRERPQIDCFGPRAAESLRSSAQCQDRTHCVSYYARTPVVG